jgi:hypothetical protein
LTAHVARAVTAAALILAAAVAVGFAGAEARASTEARGVAVSVFFPRGDAGPTCARVTARARTVVFPSVLRGALTQLLRGPTPAERRAGYGGWFSSRTSGALAGVRIARGIAYVDFHDLRRLIPNASSSCGSALLLAQLDRTALQFPGVRRTVYSINGRRSTFYEWLQRPAP